MHHHHSNSNRNNNNSSSNCLALYAHHIASLAIVILLTIVRTLCSHVVRLLLPACPRKIHCDSLTTRPPRALNATTLQRTTLAIPDNDFNALVVFVRFLLVCSASASILFGFVSLSRVDLSSFCSRRQRLGQYRQRPCVLGSCVLANEALVASGKTFGAKSIPTAAMSDSEEDTVFFGPVRTPELRRRQAVRDRIRRNNRTTLVFGASYPATPTRTPLGEHNTDPGAPHRTLAPPRPPPRRYG